MTASSTPGTFLSRCRASASDRVRHCEALPNANVGGLMAEAEAKDVHFLQSDGGSVIPASLRRHAPVTALPGPRKPAFLALESRANVSGEASPEPSPPVGW